MAQLVRDRMGAVVASLAGFMAVWAYAGALALIAGGIDFDDSIDRRLPFHSPVFAGIALALFLGVPMTIAAWRAMRAPASTAVAAGAVVVGWILVEIVVLHIFNGLQAFCLIYGICLMALGISRFRGRLS